MDFGLEFYQRFWVAFLALNVFGIAFNWFVGWCQRMGYERGFTSMFVVGGVLVTGLVFGWVMQSAELVGILAALFFADGLWMVIGAWVRYADERAEATRRDVGLIEKMLGGADAWQQSKEDRGVYLE